MAKHLKIFAVLSSLLILLCVFSTPVSAQSGDEPAEIVLGGTYTLDEGETLQGDLVVIGGTATLKPGSTLNGNIMVAGGTINASGNIDGDILSFGGVIHIKSEAVVRGDLVRFGGVFNVDEGADIQGNLVSNEGIVTDFDFFSDSSVWQDFGNDGVYEPEPYDPIQQVFSAQQIALEKFGELLWSIAKALGIAVLTIIASLFLLSPMEKSAKTLSTHPALSLGIGLLTLLAFPVLMVILMITIILIPVSIIGLIGFALVILFGWFVLSLLIGQRLAEVFKVEWSESLQAGVGALALALISAISSLVPCIGWVLPILLASAGLGAVVMSRFGTRIYSPEPKAVPSPAQASAPIQNKQLPASGAASPEPSDDLPQGLLDDLAQEDELPPLDLDNYEDDLKELGEG